MLRSLLPPREADLLAKRASQPSADEVIDLGKLFNAARRQAKVVGLFMLAGLVLAGIYLVLATPKYTAVTQILIDPTPLRSVDTTPDRLDSSATDTMLTSQIQLILSPRMALAVVDKLDLTKNPQFTKMDGGLFSGLQKIIPFLGSGGSGTVDLRKIAAAKLQDSVGVDRTGRTLAMSISFTWPDPAVAAQVANGYADAYLNDGLESNFDAMQRTSTWLQQRLSELQDASDKADLAVQQYRSDHNLIASDGQLVSEQQLSQINSQMVLAQADSARAKAQVDQFRALLGSGDPQAILNAAVATNLPDTSVVGRLRSDLQDASNRLADVTSRFGPDHPEALTLKRQVADDQQQLVAELTRIANGYENNYNVARTKEQSLRASLNQLQGTNATDNQTLVGLRSLQQRADAARQLYTTFLQRNQQATQDKSYPVQSARVIGNADKPTGASAPKKKMILGLGAVLGLLIGAGAATAREFQDRSYRNGDQVRDELGLEFLGLVPEIEDERLGKDGKRDGKTPAKAPVPTDGIFKKPRNVLGYAAEHPFSAMAETLRRAKLAADLLISQAQPKVIGVVSALPNEGKSTVAANLAQLLASQGSSVLLIDADFRKNSLTQDFGGGKVPGLLEIVLDGRSLRDVAYRDRNTGLVFLPAGNERVVSHTTELLSSPAMQQFLKQPGEDFDYVIIDLPPMAPVADARAIAALLDGTVLVIGWGKTSRSQVRNTMMSEPEITNKNLGVILNKVDMRQLKLYGERGVYDYYYKDSYYKT